MYHVHEVKHVEELGNYRDSWNHLLSQTSNATFFHTLDWLEVYWRHFGRNNQLRVLVVDGPTNPLGILPLVIRREQRKVGWVKILTYPLDDWGSYYGPIGPNPIETLHAGLNHIQQTEKRWDLLELRWVPEPSKDPAETIQVMQLAGFHSRHSVRNETAVVDLHGTWEDYLAKRTSKWRNNFRRWQKRLRGLGEVEYIRHRPRGHQHGDDDPRWDLFEDCQRIASISWQGTSTTGTTLSHDKIRDYLHDAHAVAARIGCLDMNLLKVAGDVAAFAYNYCLAGNVYGLRIGYDPKLANASPGNLLYASAIEDSFRRGDQLYDLGAGSLDCKRHWKSSIEPILQYTYSNPRAIRGQLIQWKGKFDDWRKGRLQTKSDATEKVEK